MARRDLARKLLTKLRHMPNPTAAKLLAEFRSLIADNLKAKRKAR
jgi:hypothetical protein